MALRGIKVLEFAGLAPGPFCGMILSDFGAKVVRVDKISGVDLDTLGRGKRSIAVDLKHPEGINTVKTLSKRADVLIEPFRTGVMEKLGLGPDILMHDNPGLIYSRLTGYGQKGPHSKKAGHDINYIALSGVLSMLGRAHEMPHPPVNILADFAGGGLVCALGILLALLERSQSGKGQVIDANMVEGSAYIASFLWKSRSLPGMWSDTRGKNMLDGGSAFYNVYEAKDGRYMSVGAIEPQFYSDLLKGLGLTAEEAPQHGDQQPNQEKFQEIFKTKTRDEWTRVFDGLDACVEPVLEHSEVHTHPHNNSNDSFFFDAVGNPKPKPAPRLSRTPAANHVFPRPIIGQHSCEVLKDFGFSESDVAKLLSEGIVQQSEESKL